MWRVFKQFRPFDNARRKRRPKVRRVQAAWRLSAERLEDRCYLTAAATPGDPIVTVDTNFGNFQMELFPADAPQTVTNFLSYVTSGAYANTIFHRSEQPSAANPQDIGIVQTGGFTSASTTYTSVSQFQTIPTNAPIPLEYKLANSTGTVAMARLGGSNTATATDEFFINDIDNSTTLGQSNGGGYAVFGKILGNGMQVVNQIAALSTIQADPTNTNSSFNQLPLGPSNELVRISSITLDSIDGEVFTDANGNGTLDSGEAGVAGRTVFIDSNSSGQPGGTNPTTTTDANGNYSFTGLTPGSYTVKEVVPSGMTLTTGTQTVTVTSTGTVSGVNFGEAVPAKITGTAFIDDNGNGQLDSGEPGIAGRTVFLNNDGKGVPDANNPSTTTDASGNYTFNNVAPGAYTVMEVLPANVSLITPTQTVTVTANHTTSGVNFGDRPAITGSVFNDLNLNGTLDSGEPGIASATVFLDENGTGVPANNPTQVTNANGLYAFDALAPGSYTVREVTPLGATATSHVGAVTVVAGQTAKADFGNFLGSPVAPLPVPTGSSAPSSDANTAFINGVYFQLLGHNPDSTGLSYWQQKLAGGASHQTVVQGIWDSAEHLGMVVDQFYHEFLGRASDPAGKSFWMNLFNQGATDKLEIAGFLTSKEYTNLHSTDAGFVDSLYQNLDLRSADSQGLSYWESALSGGQSREQVAMAFVNGQEATTRLLDEFYAAFLHRLPDANSQQTFVGPLEQNTLSVRDAGVAVLSSNEYFNDVSKL